MNNQSITRNLLTFALAILTIASVSAQQKASPAKSATATVNSNVITINYSSPSVKGRAIFGDLVPFDQVWRTGANEATTIEVSKDCTIAGNALKAGKYALFTIPAKGEWTVIINSVSNQWGAYKYDKAQDVFRFKTKTKAVDQTEMFMVTVSDAGKVTLAWDKVSTSFEIK